jgi:protein KTI12
VNGFLSLESRLTLSQLIIITGLPCSGKTHRARQLAAELQAHISSEAHSNKTVQIVESYHASDDTAGGGANDLRDQIYNGAAREKTARAEEFSAVKRAVSKDNIVIADGPNYIKGYRYQLWCEAKAAGTRCCVVHVAAREDECEEWNRQRLKAWGFDAGDDDKGQNPTKDDGVMPESHTAIYGDRVVDPNRSRSSSVDGRSDFPASSRPPADDTVTLKSLYINHKEADTSTTAQPTLSTNPNPTAADPSSVLPPPPPTAASPYSPATLVSLTMRYEPPSPFSRWDTPLFVVPSADVSPPTREIWTALFPPPAKATSRKALAQPQQVDKVKADSGLVKPHAATILPRATTSDALQILETATMDVVKHLLARARELGVADGGGDVSLNIPVGNADAVVDAVLHIPAGQTLSQPMLQRLRRKYTQIQRGAIAHGQGYVRGRRGVVEGFVDFLDREWNDD